MQRFVHFPAFDTQLVSKSGHAVLCQDFYLHLENDLSAES